MAVLSNLYQKYNLQFGGKITAEHLKKFEQSPQWTGKQFENILHTAVEFQISKMPSFLKEQFFEQEGQRPKQPIPVVPFDKEAFESPNDIPQYIWYGHATALFRISGKNILIDPMFGDDTTPIAPIANKRFSENTLDIIDDLPHIDLVLLTHDHYDHLDLASIQKLKGKVSQYWVALGVSRHLERWGIPKENIREFDWWDQGELEQMTITFTPSRHFAGRGVTDRNKTLWGGWVIQDQEHSIYWSGDGGYGGHFKDIQEKFGTFDWAFMECGQYNEMWRKIHMFPEDAAQAASDVKAKKIFTYHWGGFKLAVHDWNEPIERFIKKADELGLEYFVPKIGELVTFGKEPEIEYWFREK